MSLLLKAVQSLSHSTKLLIHGAATHVFTLTFKLVTELSHTRMKHLKFLPRLCFKNSAFYFIFDFPLTKSMLLDQSQSLNRPPITSVWGLQKNRLSWFAVWKIYPSASSYFLADKTTSLGVVMRVSEQWHPNLYCTQHTMKMVWHEKNEY